MYRVKFFFKKNFTMTTNILFRNCYHNDVFCGNLSIKQPINSYYTHYMNLPLQNNKIFATYVWVDSTGINLRSKYRIVDNIPFEVATVPKWSFDGSSTGQANVGNSDTLLIPASLYKDPFRKGNHIMVLCETYYEDGTPTSNNHRNDCAKTISKIEEQEPWFGIEQEYTLFDTDLWPLGWPKSRALPTKQDKFSYCGVGATHVAGRALVESHAHACIYAGMDYGGCNAEVMKGSWEFQLGPTLGIKAADDLWMARYLLQRVAEDFNILVSYHPKPMGPDHPGIGCHHNFSVKKMRADNGIVEIERVCKVLCESHKEDIMCYGLCDSEDNKKRLTGKFETSSFDSCRWAVADRTASIRIQRSVALKGSGFFEDRRPAGDCDPYRVCSLISKRTSS